MSVIGRLSITSRWALAGVVVAVMACAPEAQLQEDPEDFREEVARLQREIAEHPGEAAPLRDLGAIYVRTKRPSEGYRYLEKALSRDPNDPKTLFYLGVANERLGRTQEAQQLYRRFPKVPEDSRFRSLMRGRYDWLLRQEIQNQMAQMVQQEDTLASDISPRTVAVLPLSYQGGDEEFAPLGRGLAEMVSGDLAQIDELQLVERVRIQALLDELKLAESQYVDPKTAPRTGRILGAGRLVGGAYSVLGEEQLQVETALAEVEKRGASPQIDSHADALDQLFALEKEIVFGVAERLGIELSAQERKQIERVPTRNLQAFLAYSRGLEHEARGNFRAAAQSFRRAHEIDPGFSEAAAQERDMEALGAVAGGVDQALLAAAQVDFRPSPLNLVQNRHLMQARSLGLPATVGRQPAAEFNSLEILREPPPPPR